MFHFFIINRSWWSLNPFWYENCLTTTFICVISSHEFLRNERWRWSVKIYLIYSQLVFHSYPYNGFLVWRYLRSFFWSFFFLRHSVRIIYCYISRANTVNKIDIISTTTAIFPISRFHFFFVQRSLKWYHAEQTAVWLLLCHLFGLDFVLYFSFIYCFVFYKSYLYFVFINRHIICFLLFYRLLGRMGNICPWCKTSDESQSNNNLHDGSVTNSQHSLASSEVNDRTPFVID
jgi:hypothetical protein